MRQDPVPVRVDDDERVRVHRDDHAVDRGNGLGRPTHRVDRGAGADHRTREHGVRHAGEPYDPAGQRRRHSGHG